MRILRTTITAMAAFAATAAPALANDLGTRVQEAIRDMSGPAIYLIAFLAFGGGLFLFGKGLADMVKTSAGQQGSYGGPLTSVGVGAILIVLPYIAGVGLVSVFGSASTLGASDMTHNFYLDETGGDAASRSARLAGLATVTPPVSCVEVDATVECMARNVAKNLVPVGVLAILVACFVMGLAQLFSLLGKAVKGSNNGQGLPEGWFVKVVVAVVLMNAATLLSLTTNTLMGGGDVIGERGLNTGSALLGYSMPNSVDGPWQKYEEMVGHILVILTLFGVFAFARGLTVISAASDGRGGGTATVGGGVMFVVAGVMLVNAKRTTCLILTTVLGDGNSFGFCS